MVTVPAARCRSLLDVHFRACGGPSALGGRLSPPLGASTALRSPPPPPHGRGGLCAPSQGRCALALRSRQSPSRPVCGCWSHGGGLQDATRRVTSSSRRNRTVPMKQRLLVPPPPPQPRLPPSTDVLLYESGDAGTSPFGLLVTGLSRSAWRPRVHPRAAGAEVPFVLRSRGVRSSGWAALFVRPPARPPVRSHSSRSRGSAAANTAVSPSLSSRSCFPFFGFICRSEISRTQGKSSIFGRIAALFPTVASRACGPAPEDREAAAPPPSLVVFTDQLIDQSISRSIF